MNVKERIMMHIWSNHMIFVQKARKTLSNLHAERSDGKPLLILSTSRINSSPNLKSVVDSLKEKGEENPILIVLKRYDDTIDDKLTNWHDEISVSWTEELSELETAEKKSRKD